MRRKMIRGACGMWQSVKDCTVAAMQAVFETKVKQMDFVVTARGALKASTLWSHNVTLGPRQTLKLSEPMDDAANYVGVAAFFRDTSDAEWSVLIPKSHWKKTNPVRLMAADRNLGIDTEGRKK